MYFSEKVYCCEGSPPLWASMTLNCNCLGAWMLLVWQRMVEAVNLKYTVATVRLGGGNIMCSCSCRNPYLVAWKRKLCRHFWGQYAEI